MTYFQGEVCIVPKAKGRPRFARKGRYVTTYTDPKTAKYEEDLRILLRKAYSGDPLQDICHISIVFNLPRPDSVSPKKRPYPTVKPDLDNLIKAFKDAANTILFTDDKIVCSINAKKQYSGIGSISFTIEGK